MTSDLSRAAKIICNGGLVAFPTETVYGLGADATNDQACRKIFAVKNRPVNNPLIVHVANIEQALIIGEFSNLALKLTEFWPGPLSLVVKLNKNYQIAKSVTAGLSTIAIRCPANSMARELITLANVPIAAPSANLSGYISPTSYMHVIEHFKEEILVLKGEDCQYGIESTIIDVSGEIPVLLRSGFITKEILENAIGQKILEVEDSNSENNNNILKAPGMMLKHYSPKTPLRINADSVLPNEIALNFGNSNLPRDNGNLSESNSNLSEDKGNLLKINNNISSVYSLNLSEAGNLVEAAHNLYSMLRLLDQYAIQNSITSIAAAPIPCENIGIAINDRLRRAAS